ncbi:DUF2969 family protein [Bombilactobacillus thymidiniphilus]|uniref:DUF2969 domain-containing protein n=1 Tax=Bombilactobacillus thymidiniphilus TaxID=2923363 RepID=A0ABY4PE94_9LACO|nr:DUF2969 family protein [Bombilactobacillus thymidiniphilus]UQS83836.1 DUF2969 domain-containing protein [Bombilactobacillus thymidiniphilus]
MKTKERKFNIDLLEKDSNSWQLVVNLKYQEQVIANIKQLDTKHFEVVLVDDVNATKNTVSSLEEAVNSALMTFNLHLH